MTQPLQVRLDVFVRFFFVNQIFISSPINRVCLGRSNSILFRDFNFAKRLMLLKSGALKLPLLNLIIRSFSKSIFVKAPFLKWTNQIYFFFSMLSFNVASIGWKNVFSFPHYNNGSWRKSDSKKYVKHKNLKRLCDGCWAGNLILRI